MLLVLFNSCLKAGPHDDTKLSVASICCIVNTICFLQCHQMQHNAMQENRSIFPSAVLHFTNQFSEFITTQQMQRKAFVSLCEPSLKDRSPLERIDSLELLDATAAIISIMIKTSCF